jgi:hypothetical protein
MRLLDAHRDVRGEPIADPALIGTRPRPTSAAALRSRPRNGERQTHGQAVALRSCRAGDSYFLYFLEVVEGLGRVLV